MHDMVTTSVLFLCFQAASGGAERPALAAYATTLSVTQGEPVGLAISTTAKAVSVEVERFGATRERVWSKEGLEGTSHAIPDNASSHGCRWPVALTIPVGPEWKSGYYTARVQSSDPAVGQAEAYFIVRSARPGRDARILIQLATNTYNAYNNWGGYSLYAYHARDKVQGRRVSFDRPGGSQFLNWEAPFVAWAEKEWLSTRLRREFRPRIASRDPEGL